MGRHRRKAGEAHIAARVPEQRGPRPVSMVDAQTHLEHLVTDESAAAHRHAGNYLALCGIEVLAASLTDPGRGRCRGCATSAAS